LTCVSATLPVAGRPHASPARAAQIDPQWKAHKNFTVYDFNKPEEVPAELHHQARKAWPAPSLVAL